MIGAAQGLGNTLPILGGIAGAALAPGSMGLSIPLGVGIGEGVRRIWQSTTDVPTVDELPQEVRPWGVAGEVLGGSVIPGMGPLAATGRSPVKFLDRIVQSARRNPLAYGTAETSAATGAATGAGIASELYEGNPAAELAGGVIGGVASPGSMVLGLTSMSEGAVGRVRQWVSTAGRESRAGIELRTILSETGEDPTLLAQRLRALQQPGDNRTAAQLTGSPALQLLEAELSRRSARFGRDAARKGQDSLEVMRRMIGTLAASGDPAALREAAGLRQRYFEGLISARLQIAELEATEVAARITNDTPAARAEMSRRAEEILSGALSQARAAERELWGRIPGHAIAPRQALLAESARIAKEDMLPNERLPALVTGFLNTARRRPPTVRQMLLFRSRMLDSAREAAAGSRLNEARIFGNLAEAALDDLQGTAGADEARAFSRTLNDVFTRSFVGQALADARSGASRIPPEVLMRRATAGAVEAVDLRLQDIERAVRLGSPEAADEMLQIQERTLRIAASDIVDQNTGFASAPRLSRFMRSNEALLNRFPEIREVLHDVQSANQWLQATRDSAKQATRQITHEAAFARVAQSENPVRTVSRMLSGNAPQQQFGQLARLAHGQGEAAVMGFRGAVLQDAYERAGGAQGVFSFSAFRNALLEPPRPGQPSAMQLMRANNIIDADTGSRLHRILDEADRVEQSMRMRPQLETLLANDNMLFDLALRVAGSRAATAATGVMGQNSGSQLIAASAGSKFARTLLDKLPTGRVQDVMIAAAENPSSMATLLERAKTQQDKIRIARKMNAWLIALGFVAAPDQQSQQ